MLFSEPKIPQSSFIRPRRCRLIVSVLFSEPKIPQWLCTAAGHALGHVSVLFSEPKIPQSADNSSTLCAALRFSALQRAENSSMRSDDPARSPPRRFQCSSASRKFLNACSIPRRSAVVKFQCSSASRKFLNLQTLLFGEMINGSFSALQRAENSSIASPASNSIMSVSFSALQRAENSSIE